MNFQNDPDSLQITFLVVSIISSQGFCKSKPLTEHYCVRPVTSRNKPELSSKISYSENLVFTQ